MLKIIIDGEGRREKAVVNSWKDAGHEMLYDKMKKYQVEATCLKNFLDKYYKHDRYKGRGEEYAKALLDSHKESLEKYGYCLISHHDSKTGDAVAYFKKGVSK